MRFQALMPDILHWLGITKIDRMLSMSNMKHDAIVEQGIPILERVPIPDELIPEDSRVEIDAKIHAGYFTTGKIMNMEELAMVQGRAWDDVDVSFLPTLQVFLVYSTLTSRHSIRRIPGSSQSFPLLCCPNSFSSCDGNKYATLSYFGRHGKKDRL